MLQAITFLSLVIAFAQTGNWSKTIGIFIWVGLAAMLAFTERIALKKPELTVNGDGVSFPSGFTSKKLSWDKIESLTLRPDFLTLHLPANKYLQVELTEPLEIGTAEKLQDFCRNKINQAAQSSKS